MLLIWIAKDNLMYSGRVSHFTQNELLIKRMCFRPTEKVLFQKVNSLFLQVPLLEPLE
jgi:hypothetical protein